ncbi:MAG: phosphoribosylformylglycinamidine cyclo-ligase, partial [Deltaproteobacteria bacterium]|nr:phosphoribosylformylglycinamidine cyclo-ligase [Deltaproteobacteria bacterium]
TYREAGVDLAAADELVAALPALIAGTTMPGVASAVGGFAAAFSLGERTERRPLLVACSDGVGTKLLVALQAGRLRSVGADLVAMCVNDLATSGAQPLFFLDYLAMERLEPRQALEILAGLATACAVAGCALIGGETAELPGLLRPASFDLAGFVVGIVEEDARLDGRRAAPGDLLLGLPSSGLHANGFSLVRQVLLERTGLELGAIPTGLDRPLGEELLEPTRLYLPAVRALIAAGIPLHGLAHITGGGIPGNLRRILAPGARAVLRPSCWPLPPIFPLIRRLGEVAVEEMARVFNLGLGFVVAVPPAAVQRSLAALAAAGEPAFLVGRVEEMTAGQQGAGEVVADEPWLG